MKKWKIASGIGIIVVAILMVIPRSYFIKTEVNNTQSKEIVLTNGPREVNEFVLNVIKVQAISGDMGNAIEYTLKDIVTENEASEVLSTDSNELENIKGKIIMLGNEHPELEVYAKKVVKSIDNLQSIAKDTMPYIQNYNEEKLQSLGKEISYCFNYKVDSIGNYTVNKSDYSKELANMTYKYNKAKGYVS